MIKIKDNFLPGREFSKQNKIPWLHFDQNGPTVKKSILGHFVPNYAKLCDNQIDIKTFIDQNTMVRFWL